MRRVIGIRAVEIEWDGLQEKDYGKRGNGSGNKGREGKRERGRA